MEKLAAGTPGVFEGHVSTVNMEGSCRVIDTILGMNKFSLHLFYNA
jgi:hypothetical protein